MTTIPVLIGQRLPIPQTATGNGRVVRRRTWTEQEIRNMSSDEYDTNLMDPDFADAVNKMYEKNAPKGTEQ